MKRVIYILLPILLCGCRALPNGSSVQHQFLREHPDVAISSQYTSDETNHSRNGTRYYAEFGVVYRNANGTEHEEVWRYNRSSHSRYVLKKEQIR